MISWSRRSMAAAMCVGTMAFGSSGLGAQAINVRQASWPDSLVTVVELNRACTRAIRLPALKTVAATNLVVATQTRDQVNKVLAQARAAAKAKGGVATADSDVLSAQQDSAAADAEVVKAKKDTANAGVQMAAWNAALPPPTKQALEALCAATGSPSTWKLTELPSRRDIKVANRVEIKYQSTGENLAGSGIAGFAGINESAIVNGIAKFLVDRATAELEIAFIERIKKVACDATRKPVFESTCNTLDQEQFQLSAALMRQLRSAAEEDLRRAPRSVPLAVIATQKQSIGKPGSPDPVKQDFILSAYLVGNVVSQLLNGEEVLGAVSASFDTDAGVLATPDSGGLFFAALSRNDKSVSMPVSAGLFRLGLISKMLPDSNADGHPEWPATPLNRMNFSKTLAVNALAWISELDIADAAKVSNAQKSAALLSAQIEDTHRRAEAISKQLDGLKADEPMVLADVARLVDDGLALSENWADFLSGIGLRKDTTVVRTIRDLRVIANGIATREYARAAVGLYTLTSHTKTFGTNLPNGTTELVSFVTASASATSSDEFAKTIESFAAPVRSYRTKRTATKTYFVLNGYLGASGGWEQANGGTSGFAGVTAPVGVEFGWGNLGKDQWSIGLMAQLIDVGVLASYRLNASKDTLQAEPKAGFSQVVSPGGYLVFGVPKVPLAFGIGGNIAPQLRKVEDSGATKNAVRLSFMLAVDIPIFVLR